jgi:hypothetical protein
LVWVEHRFSGAFGSYNQTALAAEVSNLTSEAKAHLIISLVDARLEGVVLHPAALRAIINPKPRLVGQCYAGNNWLATANEGSIRSTAYAPETN